MRRRTALLVLLLAAGCSKGDPATSPLKPGQNAMLYSDDKPGVTLTSGDSNVVVPVGTKVRIASDSGASTSEFRGISIVVVEGPFTGVGCDVSRFNLRPID